MPLLRRFKINWEQNVVLGDHRWQGESMKAMQRFAKGLSREFLEFDSRYSALYDAEVRDQMRLLSSELHQFVTPDMRHLSVEDLEVMAAHGKMTYEMTIRLISYLDSKKLTRKSSGG